MMTMAENTPSSNIDPTPPVEPSSSETVPPSHTPDDSPPLKAESSSPAPVAPSPASKKPRVQTGGIKPAQRSAIATFLALLVTAGIVGSLFYYIWVYIPNRYESLVQATLQTTAAGVADGGELGSILGIPGYYAQEISIIQQFVRSRDMYQLMNDRFGLVKRYQNNPVEWRWVPKPTSPIEEYKRVYDALIHVEVDPASGILTFKAQDVSSQKAQAMAQFMLQETEAFINHLTHQMSGKKQALAEQYVNYYQKRRAEAEDTLLSLQDEYGVVLPEQELKMKQAMISELGSELSKRKLELTALLAYQQPAAPQVQAKQEEISFLESELDRVKEDVVASQAVQGGQQLNKASIQFKHIEQEMNFWNQNLNAMQKLSEVASIEKQYQMKYLNVITTPTRVEKHTHPRVWLWSLAIAVLGIFTYWGSHRFFQALLKPREPRRAKGEDTALPV
jgi:capsular polysaccharide transport system permease protein